MELSKVRFSKPELAECLSKFGYMYGVLMNASNKPPDLSTILELENLIEDTESTCGIKMPEVKSWIKEAETDLVNPNKAQLDILRAFGRLSDELRLIAYKQQH